MASYLKPFSPIQGDRRPPYRPPFEQTFGPIVRRADEQAAESATAAGNGGGASQAGGGMNFWGMMNPFASASFQGKPLFPGAMDSAPRNAQGYLTNLFGQPYGESNLSQQPGPANVSTPGPQTDYPGKGNPMVKQSMGGNALLNYLMSFGRAQAGRGNIGKRRIGNQGSPAPLTPGY